MTEPHATPVWKSWLQLVRLPNVFTALADVTMGYLVAGGAWSMNRSLILILLTTCCLYWAGMIWNDLFDLELDREERPERPLPSGRIGVSAARGAGVVLVVVGILFGWLAQASAATEQASTSWLRPGWLSIALASTILLYDGLWKPTLLGPWAMGLCRTINILMGMSVVAEPAFWNHAAPWLAASGMGIYVAGITWFARDEAVQSARRGLVHGLFWMLVGIGLLTMFPQGGLAGQQKAVLREPWLWPFLLLMLTMPVWRRAGQAIFSGQPEHVQGTIRQSLLALPVLDAALVLLMAGPIPALSILAFLAPSVILSRWIRMT